MNSPRRIKEPWLAVRRALPQRRAALLTFCSFLLPIIIWVAVSYVPFLWHPDVMLNVSATRSDSSTVFVAGDRMSKAYFPTFVEAIREQNKVVGETEGSESAIRRANKKTLRQLHPLLVANGLMSDETSKDDAQIFDAWKQVATGEWVADSPPLSEENRAIVAANWAEMKAVHETYDSSNFVSTPLLALIPQGVASNPDYLPAPHQIWKAGWRDFTAPATGDRQSMAQRTLQSIKIVFGGFLLAVLVGLPIGVLCGTYEFFSKLFEPFTDFFRYLPAPTFSTLLVAIFLANDAPKMALVFIGTVFQMILVVSKTTRLLDISLLEAAQTLGARQTQLLTRVVIPGILPNLYNDLRILLGWAWTWLVIAELIGVKSGLTEFIETQGRWRNFDSVYPVIILIGVIGFTTDQILHVIRGLLFPYTKEGAAMASSRFMKFTKFVFTSLQSKLAPAAPIEPATHTKP